MQTKTIKTYSIALCLAGFLPGCTNALYFYETEKISLIVEARPDSTQPVQGSLGIKQRVVLIAPKKNENNEAVSAITSFSFNIIPKAGTIFNPVLIQTAFITGDAAAQLCPAEAQNAAQAIEGILMPLKATEQDVEVKKKLTLSLKNIKDANLSTVKSILEPLSKALNHLNGCKNLCSKSESTVPLVDVKNALQDCIRDVSEEKLEGRTITDDLAELEKQFKQVGLITDN